MTDIPNGKIVTVRTQNPNPSDLEVPLRAPLSPTTGFDTLTGMIVLVNYKSACSDLYEELQIPSYRRILNENCQKTSTFKG